MQEQFSRWRALTPPKIERVRAESERSSLLPIFQAFTSERKKTSLDSAHRPRFSLPSTTFAYPRQIFSASRTWVLCTRCSRWRTGGWELPRRQLELRALRSRQQRHMPPSVTSSIVLFVSSRRFSSSSLTWRREFMHREHFFTLLRARRIAA